MDALITVYTAPQLKEAQQQQNIAKLQSFPLAKIEFNVALNLNSTHSLRPNRLYPAILLLPCILARRHRQ